MSRQKKKRKKHLKPTPRVDEDLRVRLIARESVADHEVRSCLSKEEG